MEIYNDVCRLCLKSTEKLENIYEFFIDEVLVINLVVKICDKIVIHENDLLPKNICEDCILILRNAEVLNDISRESELKLKQLLSIDSKETIVKEEIIEDIDNDFKVEREGFAISDELLEVKYDIGQDQEQFQEQDQDAYQNLSEEAEISSEDEDEKPTKARGKKSAAKKHQCPECKKLFEKPSKLARHIQTHDVNKKPFACDVEGCFQRFQTDASLKRHGIMHSGMTIKVQEEKIYECIVCKKHFAMQEALASHMRTHKDVMDKLEFPCQLCGEVFKKLNDLTRHSRKHPENKSHKCLICSKMFSQGSHLIDHLNRHQNLRPHVCTVCNKAFQQSSTLKDHLRTHTSEKPFLCSECGKSFNNPSNLRQHVKRHLNLKEFSCHLCPGKFSCKASLDSHIRSHSGIKPHVCSQCGSSFTKGSSLKKHVRTIHEGIKPFECEACSMKFNSSEHLKRHFRTHTGEKPYICDFDGCSRAYAQSNDLLKHKKIHVGELVYKCTICTEAFRLQSQLRDHYKVHYENDKNEENLL